MFVFVALLCFHGAHTKYATAATIEHSFREVEFESGNGTVCPEEHTTFNASTLSALVCAALCSAFGDGCLGVNFNLSNHGCLGCNTSNLSSSEGSETHRSMIVLVKLPEIVATKVDIINLSGGCYRGCWISASALLPGNKWVLTDYNDDTISLVDMNTSTVKSELVDFSHPYDMAIITEDQVAVTLRFEEKIALVNVTSVLKLDRNISVDGQCLGILYHSGKLIVAFREPAKIEIMGLDGSVERQIECSGITQRPSYIALNPGHNVIDVIYVTDYYNSIVKRINIDGETEAQYTDNQLLAPRGIIVDHRGRVFVCSLWADNIHVLTADLTKIKLLKDGIRRPESLSIDRTTNRLYVGGFTDNIIVYQLA